MSWTARREGLIVTETDGDLVVYDEQTSHLHALPASITLVWRRCDGVSTVDQIAVDTGLPPAEVQAALKQLAEVGLIQGDRIDDGVRSLGRRRFVRQATLGAAIVSVTAPMAASATSVAPAGQCWWLNFSNVWVTWPADYVECQWRDSCFGGGNGSGGATNGLLAGTIPLPAGSV